MIDSNFKEKLKKLKDQVNKFSDSGNGGISKKIMNIPILSKINIKSSVYGYISVPLLVFTILFFWSPAIITHEISVNGEIPKKKLSFKKLLTSTIFMTVIILSSFFFYLYRKKER